MGHGVVCPQGDCPQVAGLAGGTSGQPHHVIQGGVLQHGKEKAMEDVSSAGGLGQGSVTGGQVPEGWVLLCLSGWALQAPETHLSSHSA